jgi:hypothetical protein
MLKISLATLAGTVFYFLFGWLVFEGILGHYMSANTTQIAGFKKSEWANITTFKEGVIIGAIVGILVAVMTNFYWYSTSHFFNTITPLLADVAAAGVTVGLMGGVIAWVLGYMAE